jgi:hypothetical protein
VPPRPIRQLRDFTRYRIDLVEVETAEKNRVEKLLEDACIILSVVASDIFGVSGRAMMAALIAGERDHRVLAEMARTRMRVKIPPLVEAFTGHFDDHHRFLLAQVLARIDGVDGDIALDAQIETLLAKSVCLPDAAPGVVDAMVPHRSMTGRRRCRDQPRLRCQAVQRIPARCRRGHETRRLNRSADHRCRCARCPIRRVGRPIAQARRGSRS